MACSWERCHALAILKCGPVWISEFSSSFSRVFFALFGRKKVGPERQGDTFFPHLGFSFVPRTGDKFRTFQDPQPGMLQYISRGKDGMGLGLIYGAQNCFLMLFQAVL